MDTREEALEWALALSKAPAERVVLRQRPLPNGILALLQIAAGSAESLGHFPSTTGEDPDQVREAARFYVREVMFHQGADAYRVLGVERDASSEELRAHYRLLQQWLHPDRQTSDWDAIFAGRVNAAWSQLRTDERRVEYDLRHPPRRFDPALEKAHGLPWQVADAAFSGMDEWARWRRRLPAFALFAICAVLGLLAVRDMQREPAQQVAREQPADVLIRVPAALEKKLGVKDVTAAPASDRAQASAKPLRGKSSTPRSSTDASMLAKAPAASKRVSAGKLESATLMPDQSAPAAAVARPAEAVPQITARARNTPDMLAAVTQLESMERARNQAPKAPERSSAATGENPEVQPIAGDIPNVPERRVQQARQVGGLLISFMTTTDATTPPIWNSLVTQRGATQLRDGFLDAGAPRVANPSWRVGDKVAAMRADIRYRDGQSGRLTADLVWREQRWLVTGLSIERDL